ncbi:MAG TPA: TadE/TadG family type IV pilus assembly protein, partial [Croceibacterium sp.]|nr:TadE/TadG family type IV pilus assembly protein [Croceibacterium sp.]
MAQDTRADAGILRKLLSDTKGNVLAITAAATIPMLGVIGGAVDISRVYLVKSRVQAACDSAVLAGRKAMTTLTYTTAAQTRARNMFNFNFQDADYGTTSTTFTTTANAQGVVSGTASTTVPMVLMNVLGVQPTGVSVTCSADIQIPNIDVVFVLDVTGSMNDCPDGNCNNSPSGEVRKIESLR